MKTLFILLVCLVVVTNPARAKPHPKSAPYEAAVKASIARATSQYPEYAEDGTPLHNAIQDEIERQKEINPGYFKNTDWPERIARACAAVLGIEPARAMEAAK